MKVLISGVQREYREGTVQIQHQLGIRSTAAVVLLHRLGVHFSRHQSIEIQTDAGARRFSGFILPRERHIPGPEGQLETVCEAIDGHYRCDKRHIRQKFEGQTCGAIVSSIITSTLSAEGITAGTIQAGTSLPVVDFPDTRCSDAIQQLAEASGFIWYVDANNALHFMAPGSSPAPFDLYWDSVIEGTLEVERYALEYRNRVRVRGTAVELNNTTEQTRMAALEGTSGIVEDSIEGYHLVDAATQTSGAQKVLDEYSQEEIRVTWDTRDEGLEIGQTITARIPEHDLNGTELLIRSITEREDTVHETMGVLYTVEATSGPVVAGPMNRVSSSIARGSTTQAESKALSKAPTGSFAGLLMSHEDDVSSLERKVRLHRLDYLVTDEGQIVEGSNFRGKTLSLAGTGAGGLDTGAVASSTWYELHGIVNPSSGTFNLIATLATQYTAEEFFATTPDTNNAIGNTVVERQGQSFVLATGGPVDFIDLQVHRSGTPTDFLKISIQTDSAGSPSGTVVTGGNAALIQTPVPPNSNAANTTYSRLWFPERPTLSTGVTYWLVFQRTGSADVSNFWTVRGLAAGGYADGVRKTYAAGSWSAASGDLTFTIFRTIDSALALPSGYTQSALLGFIRTNSSSVIEAFQQANRRVRWMRNPTTHSFGTGAAVSRSLKDLSGDIPPCPVWAQFRLGQGLSAIAAIIAGVPHGYHAGEGHDDAYESGAMVSQSSPSGTWHGGDGGRVLTMGNAAYFFAEATSTAVQARLVEYEWLTRLEYT